MCLSVTTRQQSEIVYKNRDSGLVEGSDLFAKGWSLRQGFSSEIGDRLGWAAGFDGWLMASNDSATKFSNKFGHEFGG